VQGLAPDRTVYIGTTSKTLAPAVRLGWLAAPDEVTAGLGVDGGGGFTGLTAHAFARLLRSGAYERHVQRCRREYRRRRDALAEALAQQLPQLRVIGIAGGLHLTLLLPEGRDADEIAQEARSHGVDIRPLSVYTHHPLEHKPGLVMGYGRLPLAGVPAVTSVLAQALSGRVPQPAPRGGRAAPPRGVRGRPP
jgi:GntR family transcriptional regulator/MocR family aminotransferase